MLMQILRCVHTTTRSCISSRSIGPEQNNLLEAARNLEERILPLSTMLELQRADNSAYQKQIASLEGKLKQTESLDGKVSRLRVRLGEAEKNYETAASLAEKVAKRAAAKQDEIGRLKESLERYRHALKNKDEEVQRTKAALELKETQVWLPFCHLYISFAY